MDLAIGASSESVVKAGNDYADKATSVNDPLKAVLGEMADSFTALSEAEQRRAGLGKFLDELDYVDFSLVGTWNWHWRGVLHGPKHLCSYFRGPE